MHERLVADADSLGISGHLSRDRIATFRDARSHQGALNGVVGIVGVLRETWSAVAAHTPITVADLARADALAKRFDAALAIASCLRSTRDAVAASRRAARTSTWTTTTRSFRR